MASRNAQGITITFGTLTFAAAQITGFTHSAGQVPVLDSSHLGTTSWRSKIFGKLKEPGTITLEVYADPDEWDHLYSEMGTSDTLTMDFPEVGAQVTGATIAGSAGLVNAEMTGSVDELITGSIEIAWAGALTVTPGA